MSEKLELYKKLILDYAKNNYHKMLRDGSGILNHKFIVPGSCYSDDLWDWDSWLTDIALRKIAPAELLVDYEKGCVINFLEDMKEDGRINICIISKGLPPLFANMKNVHKPCLAQHALFVSESIGDFEWLRDYYGKMETFLGYYERNCRHGESGLYFWTDDSAIGVDNDPCTFYRPAGSSASIYLNCLMYMELGAMAKIAHSLGLADKEEHYAKMHDELLGMIREHCWDERDGFYYSTDINLVPVDPNVELHRGAPRTWPCLIQRIGVWTGFMAMWAGIATPEQAERMVNEHLKCEKTFCSPYGVRSLSRMEKMYTIRVSGNPSCWLGPIWGIANYMTFEGLIKYGYLDEAEELAKKTITLFGQDLEKNGDIHEYYDPETGAGVHNKGFQSWNLLAVNMIEWLESRH